jgi:indole-3-glycerol phosphate synthase
VDRTQAAGNATLDEILAATRARLPELRGRRSALERAVTQAPAPRSFTQALHGDSVAIVAEIKRRSPSAGTIRETLDPAARAAAYETGGAAVISVLTDGPYFGGSLDDLAAVSRAVRCPVLRKDFILDDVQLLEARAAGADAVLLIVRALAEPDLRHLASRARALDLATLVEVHTEPELETALAVSPSAIGVNSRDLGTFTIDAPAAWRLIARAPLGVLVVAESGIASRDDVTRAAAAGADAVLVGTSLSRSADPTRAVRDLAGVARRSRG